MLTSPTKWQSHEIEGLNDFLLRASKAILGPTRGPCVCAGSLQFDSLKPYGLQPTRLLCSRDSPGKNTGVGCHVLLQGGGLPSWLRWCFSICLHMGDPGLIPWLGRSPGEGNPFSYNPYRLHGVSKSQRRLPPGDFPGLGIKTKFPVSPELQADSLQTEPPEKPYWESNSLR